LPAGRLNVTTIELPNIPGSTGGIVEGGLFHIFFERASQLYVDGDYDVGGLYTGKLYVLGMSVVANF
jgi:hypothetical protein